MFRCQLCQTVVPANTRATKIVVATRTKTYSSRGNAPQQGRGGFRGRRNEPSKPYDKGGVGTEIVREAAVCPDCAAKHEIQLQSAAAAAAKEQALIDASIAEAAVATEEVAAETTAEA